jgi:hypothetical protein
MDFSQLKGAQDHIDAYASLTSGQGFGVPRGAKEIMQKHAEYIKKNLDPSAQRTAFTKIKSHANALYVADEISDSDREFIHKTYSPTVKESTDMDIQEKKMTEPEMKKREKMVKSMKKNFGDFKKRYGERAKEVMYATATKQAMKSEGVEQTEALVEEINHYKIGEGETPKITKYKGKNDVHLLHTNGGRADSNKAEYKVLHVGANHAEGSKKTDLGIKYKDPRNSDEVESRGLKVGQKLTGREVNDYLEDSYGSRSAANIHIHSPRPNKIHVGLNTIHGMDEETEQIEGQHYCAKHVYSDIYGEGVVVEGQHAEPDENGNIEWYTVQFEHGEEVIFTEDVEVMMAEYHMNHSPMKKKAKKAKE